MRVTGGIQRIVACTVRFEETVAFFRDVMGLAVTEEHEQQVATFFYGSYMNMEVLKEFGLTPDAARVARLPGFAISIRPLANLIPSDQHVVYGILAFWA